MSALLPDSLTGCERCEVISIVAPELIRYRAFRDLIESTALEVLYIQGGVAAADYSIGPFQMKPSFIEKLECHISAEPQLQRRYPFVILRESVDDRKIRLHRLKDPRWQVLYALSFWELRSQQPSLSRTEKINFLSAAYNYGFDKDPAAIRRWQHARYFPYGKKYGGQQYAYSEFAMAFFNKCITQFKQSCN